MGFQNYKQKYTLQDYLIAQKKGDGGVMLVVEVKEVQYSRADVRELLEVELLGNRMNVGEGDGKRNKE